MAFDCLYLEGRDLRPLPLRARRRTLSRSWGAITRCSSRLGAWPPTASRDGAQVLERGYEGMIGKDEVSPYHELKVKKPGYREVARGWTPKPNRSRHEG
jgi:ATP-dependent DNA ligase